MITVSDKIVTARKKHTCFGCLGEILQGDQYDRSCISDGGKAYTVKLCALCLDYLSDANWCEGDEFSEGELKMMMKEEDWPDERSCRMNRDQMLRAREARKETT